MRRLHLILLGAPGSGKGTQARQLARAFGVPMISTGELLRTEVARGSDVGMTVSAAMAAGGLVEDDLVIELIQRRLNDPEVTRGFVLDGFLRALCPKPANWTAFCAALRFLCLS